MEEVASAIKKLNNNSSAGPNVVNAKLLNIKEPKRINEIHAIIACVLTMEKNAF